MSTAHIVSSFLALGPLLLTLCNSYANAPKQFRDLSQEILSLHVVHNQVKAQLPTKGGHNTPTLSANYTHDLEVLYDGLHTIIKDLGDLLEKYKSLTKNCSISFDRLRWGKEDIGELRQRILIHACLLSAFNTSLLWYVGFLPRFLLIELPSICKLLLYRHAKNSFQYAVSNSENRMPTPNSRMPISYNIVHKSSRPRNSSGNYLQVQPPR